MTRAVVVACLWLLAGCGDDGASAPDAPLADAAAPDAAVDAAVDAPPDAFEGPGMDLPITAEFQALADHLEAWRLAGGIRNASFLIMQGGEIVFAHGFGESGRGDGFKAKATSLYRIASLTKMLTATVAMQDVAAERIDLDAPITTYLPDFDLADQPGATATITPRHLLSHQSGLRDYLPANSFTTEPFVDAYLTGAAEDVFYQLAPAGTFFNYSNTGYYYAGLLTQRAGTQFYREAMRDRLFTPLGMTRTTFLAADVQADGDFAVGVSTRNGLPVDVLPNAYDNTWARPAAHAFSSVIDLAEYVRFLRSGNPTVLPEAQRTLFMTPQVSTKDYYDYYRYAFGLIWQDGRWVGDSYYDVDVYWHDGLMPGFRSELMWVPELDFAFIALAGNEDAVFWELEEWAMARYATLPAPTTAPSIEPDPSRWPSFAGEYHDDLNLGGVIITVEGDHLRIEMPLLDEMDIPYEPVMESIGGDTFLLGIDGAQTGATFFLDEQGEHLYMRTRAAVAVAGEATPARRPRPDRWALRARLRDALMTEPLRTHVR